MSAASSPPHSLPIAIAADVRRAGGRALIVGGWVRDRLLGLDSKDVDLEIFGLPIDRLREVLARFGTVEPIGQSFPVFKIEGIDVALPRRESKAGRGHTGFLAQADPFMSIAEAARRRDFTINAISFDPLTGEYEDPCSGRDDLDRRVLRVVDRTTFGDDSLRVLRAVQFSARFDLTPDEDTIAICRSVALDDLPAERIWGELEKLLLLPARPSTGFELARELSVIERLFPELRALFGCQQEPEWHPEGDVWIHTLMVVDQARGRIDDLARGGRVALMLGAVTHDFGKPATTAFIEGRIRSRNHEEAGVEPALAFLDRLRVHHIDGVDVRAQVAGMVAQHLKPGMWHKTRDEIGDGAFRRLAQKVDLELLARLAKSDCLGRTGYFDCSAMDWFLARARALGVEHRPPAPLLLGRHVLALGATPGPQVGAIVRSVYEQQLDGVVKTLDEAIAAAKTALRLS